MILAVDIGNSSVSFGLFDGAELRQSFAFPTSGLTDSPTGILPDVLREFSEINTVAIASVVPSAIETITAILTKTLPKATVLMLSNADIPMKNGYKKPSDLGSDRLLSAVGAFQYYSKDSGRPIVVADFGTATTIDCVSSEGVFLGGTIGLGIASTIDALSIVGSQLPKAPLQFPPSVLGTSTEMSIQSGVLYGAVFGFEGIVSSFRTSILSNESPIVVATGGYSHLFRGYSTIIDHFDPNLVLRGIVITALSL